MPCLEPVITTAAGEVALTVVKKVVMPLMTPKRLTSRISWKEAGSSHELRGPMPAFRARRLILP